MRMIAAAMLSSSFYLVHCHLSIVLTQRFKLTWQLEESVCDRAECCVAYNLSKLWVCDINAGR